MPVIRDHGNDDNHNLCLTYGSRCISRCGQQSTLYRVGNRCCQSWLFLNMGLSCIDCLDDLWIDIAADDTTAMLHIEDGEGQTDLAETNDCDNPSPLRKMSSLQYWA